MTMDFTMEGVSIGLLAASLKEILSKEKLKNINLLAMVNMFIKMVMSLKVYI